MATIVGDKLKLSNYAYLLDRTGTEFISTLQTETRRTRQEKLVDAVDIDWRPFRFKNFSYVSTPGKATYTYVTDAGDLFDTERLIDWISYSYSMGKNLDFNGYIYHNKEVINIQRPNMLTNIGWVDKDSRIIGYTYWPSIGAQYNVLNNDKTTWDNIYTSSAGEIFNDYIDNIASGNYSHAEGINSKATGDYSHSEGSATTASGNFSHAEGQNSTASGAVSHVEGFGNNASGNYSHAEGWQTTASGNNSHAEGFLTKASNQFSHAEGWQTTASGENSHAEGEVTTASGKNSHAEGSSNTAYGKNSHAEGSSNTAYGNNSHAEGWQTTASGDESHAEGLGGIKTVKVISTGNPIAEYTTERYVVASGEGSHAEGIATVAQQLGSHAEGVLTYASGAASHSEGALSYAHGLYSHAEGYLTNVYGIASHVEGYENTSYGDYSHVTGAFNTSNGESNIVGGEHNTNNANFSFVNGYYNTNNADQSFINGFSTNNSGANNILLGEFLVSHSFGSVVIGGVITNGKNDKYTYSNFSLGSLINNYGDKSFAIGRGINTIDDQFILGRNNAEIPETYFFALGYGTSITNRQNAITVTQDGWTYIGALATYINNIEMYNEHIPITYNTNFVEVFSYKELKRSAYNTVNGFPAYSNTYTFSTYSYILPTKQYVDKLLELKDAFRFAGTFEPSNTDISFAQEKTDHTVSGTWIPATWFNNEETNTNTTTYDSSTAAVWRVKTRGWFGTYVVDGGDLLIAYADASRNSDENWAIIETHMNWVNNTGKEITNKDNRSIILTNFHLTDSGILSYTYAPISSEGRTDTINDNSSEKNNISTKSGPHNNKHFISNVSLINHDDKFEIAYTYTDFVTSYIVPTSGQYTNVDTMANNNLEFVYNVYLNTDGILSYTKYSLRGLRHHHHNESTKNSYTTYTAKDKIDDDEFGFIGEINLSYDGKLTYITSSISNLRTHHGTIDMTYTVVKKDASNSYTKTYNLSGAYTSGTYDYDNKLGFVSYVNLDSKGTLTYTVSYIDNLREHHESYNDNGNGAYYPLMKKDSIINSYTSTSYDEFTGIKNVFLDKRGRLSYNYFTVQEVRTHHRTTTPTSTSYKTVHKDNYTFTNTGGLGNTYTDVDEVKIIDNLHLDKYGTITYTVSYVNRLRNHHDNQSGNAGNTTVKTHNTTFSQGPANANQNSNATYSIKHYDTTNDIDQFTAVNNVNLDSTGSLTYTYITVQNIRQHHDTVAYHAVSYNVDAIPNSGDNLDIIGDVNISNKGVLTYTKTRLQNLRHHHHDSFPVTSTDTYGHNFVIDVSLSSTGELSGVFGYFDTYTGSYSDLATNNVITGISINGSGRISYTYQHIGNADFGAYAGFAYSLTYGLQIKHGLKSDGTNYILGPWTGNESITYDLNTHTNSKVTGTTHDIKEATDSTGVDSINFIEDVNLSAEGKLSYKASSITNLKTHHGGTSGSYNFLTSVTLNSNGYLTGGGGTFGHDNGTAVSQIDCTQETDTTINVLTGGTISSTGKFTYSYTPLRIYQHHNIIDVRDVRGENKTTVDRLPSYYADNHISTLFNNANSPLSSTDKWYSGLNVKGWTGENYSSWQLVGPAASGSWGERLYYRSAKSNTEWNDWEKLIFYSDISHIISNSKHSAWRQPYWNNGPQDIWGDIKDTYNITSYTNNMYDIGSNINQYRNIYANKLTAQTNSSLILSANNSKHMYIATNGNVGINSGTPEYTLDVRGITRSNNFISSVATGIQPYACSSTTLNTNLNADMVDGVHFKNILERNSSLTFQITPGDKWYRIGQCIDGVNHTNTFTLFVDRESNNRSGEGYSFNISISRETDYVIFNQLSGTKNATETIYFKTIRVSWKPDGTIYIDLQFNSESNNVVKVTGIGAINIYDNVINNPTAETNVQTWSIVNGIGTNSTLHIKPTLGSYSEGIRLYGTSADNSWSNIQFGCNPASLNGTHTNQWILGRNDSNNFILDVNGSSGSIMTWLRNGNVGIGKTAPGYKLDVNGQVRITNENRNETIILDSTNQTAKNQGAGIYFRNPSDTSQSVRLRHEYWDTFVPGYGLAVSVQNNLEAGDANMFFYNTGRFISKVPTGTQPYECASTTLNTNLNADLLDGKHANEFATASHTHAAHTHTLSSIHTYSNLTEKSTESIILSNNGASGTVNIKEGFNISLNRSQNNEITIDSSDIDLYEYLLDEYIEKFGKDINGNYTKNSWFTRVVYPEAHDIHTYVDTVWGEIFF